LRHAPGVHRDADLVEPTRELLVRSGKPYVIENVIGAPLIEPVMLCGTMFGLETPDHRAELQRHRLFETSFTLSAPACQHSGRPVIGVYGGHFRDRRRDTGKNHRGGSNYSQEDGFAAMGVPVGSMTNDELSESIPPAYAKFIAEAFLRWRAQSAVKTEAVA
jgi:DNA (cytosine-5)-methyltransferase 1